MQRGEGDGAREVPAAVLVVQAVVGKAGEGFGPGSGALSPGLYL